jgi:hypothetical protein
LNLSVRFKGQNGFVESGVHLTHAHRFFYVPIAGLPPASTFDRQFSLAI